MWPALLELSEQATQLSADNTRLSDRLAATEQHYHGRVTEMSSARRTR